MSVRTGPVFGVVVAVFVALLTGGCVTGMNQGDRFFLAGDLEQAELAYRNYLSGGDAVGAAQSRARYRLGLIYAMPGTDLYDWARAERAFKSLIRTEPDSTWARQASFLLALHSEQERLETELAAVSERASLLLHQVARLQQEAQDAGDEVEDREALMQRLTDEIGTLRREMGDLGDQLAAREQELERIKKIDLQTPP